MNEPPVMTERQLADLRQRICQLESEHQSLREMLRWIAWESNPDGVGTDAEKLEWINKQAKARLLVVNWHYGGIICT